MHIGIDTSCWWSRRGFGRFTRELVKAMLAQPGSHRFCLFVDREPEPEMQVDCANIVRVQTDRPVTEAAVASGSRTPREVLAFSRAVCRERLDGMFFPAVYSWFPVPPGLPSVVTLHDSIAEHFPGLVFPNRRGRLMWGLKVRLALWQARRIMTVSRAAHDEIVEHLRVAPDRIDLVSEAADARFVPVTDKGRMSAARSRSGLPADARLLLYVGGLAPHKNLAGMLDGFSLINSQTGLQDVHVAFIGDPEGDGFHSHFNELNDRVQNDPRLKGRVHFTGFVSDDDLVALYSDSLALILPSFSEGFGLPAIEAMACGIPVLVSRAGSLPEVVGEAGLYFNPHEPAQIGAAMVDIATNATVREELARTAIARAAEFSWEQAATKALTCLKRALEPG